MTDVAFTSWGSANSIGPSCHVLQFGSYRVGIDYGAGIREGEDEPRFEGSLDALFITHAHRDHAGMLPRAIARWPKMRCWATFETMALARWIWEDEINISHINRRPEPFSKEDVAAAARRVKRLLPHQEVHLTDEVSVTAFPAGHILGAVGLVFRYRGESYVATGDICLRDHGFIPGAEVPDIAESRLLIRESTYVGQYLEEERAAVKERLLEKSRAILEQGGRVVIPTLSIDRMPEICELFYGSDIPSEWPVWVVGGPRPVQIYLDYADGTKSLQGVRRFEHWKHQQDVLKSEFPMVVIASSGMLVPNTPSYTWATAVLGDKDSAIYFVNWQDPCQPGGIIADSNSVGQTLKLPTGNFVRMCDVDRFHLSSHGMEDEMKALEIAVNPQEVVHVHGEGARIQAFVEAERGRGPARRMAIVGEVVSL